MARHPQRDLLREKARLQARAAVRMGVDAVNVGRAELADGLPYLLQLARETRLPLVSANLRKKGGGHPFPRWRVLTARGSRVAVFGLLAPDPKRDESLGIEVSDPVQAAREALKEFSGEATVVCLANLGLEAERRLATEVPGIAYIVGSGSNELLDPPEVVGETALLHAGEQGKYLGVVERGKPGPQGHRLIALDPSVPDAPEIADWVATFKKAEREWRRPPDPPPAKAPDTTRPPAGRGNGAGEAPPVLEEPKRRPPAPGEHAGSDACRNCHPGEHQAWRETRHARAYASLDGNVQDGRCLNCHSTLLRRPEGSAVEPDVACEACHGPGAAHSGKGKILRKVPEAVCRSCHRGFHERRKFDWKEAYEKVRCDRAAKAARSGSRSSVLGLRSTPTAANR